MYFYTSTPEIILLIIFIFRTVSLSKKVEKLKLEVEKLKSNSPTINPQKTPVNVAETLSSPLSSTISPAPTQIVGNPIPASEQKIYSTQPIPQSNNNDVDNWLKENILLKIGVMMILIAFGWFISYAFVHNWIGPIGRVALGFVTGTILALFGTMRMGKNINQGTTFLILGSGITVITAFASQVIYNFFSPTVALLIPFIVGLYVATVAATYNQIKIGIYAVILGFLAPILTHTTHLDLNLLYIYLFITSCSCLWLAFRKDWGVINAISLTGVLMYSMHFLGSTDLNNFILTLLFALAFIYFLVSMTEIICAKKDVDSPNLFVAMVNGIFIFMLILVKIRPEFQSIFCAIWMVIFAFGSMLVFAKTGKKNFFYIYSLIAVALLGEATAFELSGPALTFAFAIESFAISIGSYLITKNTSVGLRMSSLMIIPGIMAIPALTTSPYYSGDMMTNFMIILIDGVLFISLGYFYSLMAKEKNEEEDKLCTFHIIVGSLFLLRLIWLFLQNIFLSQASLYITTSLVIYTIIGIITYFRGTFSHKHAMRTFGAFLLGFVVVRLLIIDVWSMPLASRIIVFVLIGILFISTAFIIKKDKKTMTTN